MGVVYHGCKASRVSPQVEGEDVINSMPDNVVTNIMDRLPLRDAVRTSILSTSWRFKWTLVTQLVFDEDFFDYLLRREICFDKTNISRFLFHLKGAITKFVLHIRSDTNIDDEDIHHLVMFLSRVRGFKELTLINRLRTPVKLPTHLFSCLELTHLKLRNFVLSPSPYFRGFPKLLSLKLLNVGFQGHRFGELIAQCPFLETLDILCSKLKEDVKLVEIAKLENVKMLSLSLCLLDNMTMVRLSTVLQYVSRLPRLQELLLGFGKCKFLPEDVAQYPVSITFPVLKTLTLFEMDFSCDSMLCAFGMLFGSTNLQTLIIIAVDKEAGRKRDIEGILIGHMQLQSVLLTNIIGTENEVCLIKSILGHSPFLNKITIDQVISDGGDVKFSFVDQLLRFPRASPTAVIAVCPLE